VYYGNGLNSLSEPQVLEYVGTSQPFIADLNGDMRMDITGYVKDSNILQTYTHVKSKNTFTQYVFLLFSYRSSSPASNFINTATCALAPRHPTAFIDMNGDCLPDIVFSCESSIQIWINKKEKGFIMEREYTMPAGYGPLSFSDINADGTTDLVYGRCDRGLFGSGSCFIDVVYNKQRPFCLGQGGDCISTENLCVADDNFAADFQGVKLFFNQY